MEIGNNDVENVYNLIRENRQNRIDGKFNAIPFANKPNFSSIIPGIMHKRYYLVTGPQKSGKTSYVDDTFVFDPVNWVFMNQESGITIKIFYFTLEMSKEEKIIALISRMIFNKTGQVISSEKLQSLFNEEDGILSESQLEAVEQVRPLIEQMMSCVEFIETERNPYGIYKTVETYMDSVGSWTYKTINFNDGKGPQRVKDKYTKNDPNHYVMMVTDHIGLLSPERNLNNIREIISKFSSHDCITLRNRYSLCVVNIQQLSAESQTKEFHKGASVVEKLKPSVSSLGENKTTGRDCNVMISIFNPYIYGVQSNNGYDILATQNGLRDHYREIIINLNRHGRSNVSVDMFFNGAVGTFKELPPPNHPDLSGAYAYAKTLDSN